MGKNIDEIIKSLIENFDYKFKILELIANGCYNPIMWRGAGWASNSKYESQLSEFDIQIPGVDLDALKKIESYKGTFISEEELEEILSGPEKINNLVAIAAIGVFTIRSYPFYNGCGRINCYDDCCENRDEEREIPLHKLTILNRFYDEPYMTLYEIYREYGDQHFLKSDDNDYPISINIIIK
jgi:hypothetical protein